MSQREILQLFLWFHGLGLLYCGIEYLFFPDFVTFSRIIHNLWRFNCMFLLALLFGILLKGTNAKKQVSSQDGEDNGSEDQKKGIVYDND